MSEDSRMSIDSNTPLKREIVGRAWVDMLEDSNSASMVHNCLFSNCFCLIKLIKTSHFILGSESANTS